MKLSTAIRIGSMTTKQVSHVLDDGHNGKCALGAAADATNSGLDRQSLGKTFPILETKGNKLKQHYLRGMGMPTSINFAALGSVIVEWNDKDQYTREEIANLIEMCEEAEEYFEKYGRKSSYPVKKEIVQKESEVSVS